ncbi:1-phosphofructokinase family hexose kinase [Agromyces kandeliae]|uniref:1-phosphofructokinase family hexose kinase n=1 Tax=Agromyces kandeliae TaxID=2666141 RepID=UPI0012AF200C|nr:PfkB family carbohydrate kinase [Agromyces kandeliae]
MILALSLSTSLDLTYEVDALRVGAITRPRQVTPVAGGKALNMARAAVALGGEVHAVAAVGGFTGERVARLLRNDGVGLTAVPVSGETRTCIAIVEPAGGATSTDIYEPPAAFADWDWRAFADAAIAAVGELRPGWIVVSGSVPRGIDLDGLAGVVRGFRVAGARVALDTSGAPLAALVEVADLVKVNLEEASDLVGRALPDAAEACRELGGSYGVDAVVTNGVRGAAAIVDGGAHVVGPPRARGRFPAGSGDAFLAGFIVALHRGIPAAGALALAGEAGERNAMTPGQGRLGAAPQP